MIHLNGVSHSIGSKPILHDINLTIPAHGITALVGPNGAGKSTLLSLMARLQPLQTGQIRYGDLNLATTPSHQLAKRLSILTQEHHIHSRIRVRDLLLFGRYPHHQGRPQTADHAVVDQALHQFELNPLAECYLNELSGGQRQRAMIAMVFCQGTDYVLLDEPLNNLDIYHARSLMRLLCRLTHEHNRTTVVVLHDINQAAAYADTVIAMQNGRVVLNGHPDTVITPANLQQVFGIEADVLPHRGKSWVLYHR